MTQADLELAPCPFCGGEASFSEGQTGDGKPWLYVECLGCSASGPSINYADHGIALKECLAAAWNERSSPNAEKASGIKFAGALRTVKFAKRMNAVKAKHAAELKQARDDYMALVAQLDEEKAKNRQLSSLNEELSDQATDYVVEGNQAKAERDAEKARADRLLEGMRDLRADWLEENAPNDGSDVVTPFDRYLHREP